MDSPIIRTLGLVEYDLTVKGFKCGTDDATIRNAVGVFLQNLLGFQQPLPIKYNSHRLNSVTKTLELAFVVDDPNITLDKALKAFCKAFFETENTGVHKQLSTMNTLGYFPSSERMKLAWYEALFLWLHTEPERRLKKVKDSVKEINKQGEQSPKWTKAAALSVSLGVSLYLGKESVELEGSTFEYRTINKNAMDIADGMLGTFAAENESRSDSAAIAQEAKENCEKMMECSKSAADKMKIHFDDEASRTIAHSEILENLVELFETGAETITLCTEAKNSFVKSRNIRLISSLFYARELAVLGYNAFAAVSLFADATVALPRPDWEEWEAYLRTSQGLPDSWLSSTFKFLGFIDVTPEERQRSRIMSEVKQSYEQQRNAIIAKHTHEFWWEIFWRIIIAVLLAFGLFVFNGGFAYKAERERKKWAAATGYVDASILHAQYCEVYLKWVYLARPISGGEDSDTISPASAAFGRVLESRMKKLNAKVPTEADCSPSRIRIRVKQYGKMLDDERAKLGQCLGLAIE